MHNALETRVGFDMRPFKEYIDNEILVTMAQMDKPSKIFDYLYLVRESSTQSLLLCRGELRLSRAGVKKLTEVCFH